MALGARVDRGNGWGIRENSSVLSMIKRRKKDDQKSITIEGWDELGIDGRKIKKDIPYTKMIAETCVFNEKFVRKSSVDSMKWSKVMKDSTAGTEQLLNSISAAKEDYEYWEMEYELEWRELRRQIIREYKQNNAMIVYDEVSDGWVLCAWVPQWESKSEMLASWFRNSAKHFRVCCRYYLLGLPEIQRRAIPFKDYIPLKYVRRFNKRVMSNVDLDMLEEQEEWEKHEAAMDEFGVDETEPTSSRRSRSRRAGPSNTIIIDLSISMFVSHPYRSNCMSTGHQAGACQMSCCLTLYSHTNFCTQSVMNCAVSSMIVLWR